jgi:drug/metabolite transporter (DMT)-like permease
MNRNAMCLGAALLLAGGLLFERDQQLAFTPQAVFSIVYLALFGTVLTFGLYLWLLRYAPAYRLSLIAYVTPVIALTLGWLLADEPLELGTLAGSALVLFGVALAVRGRRATRAPAPGAAGGRAGI